MPARAKTTDAQIIQAARRLVERDGQGFSMHDVAAAIGIRTPSLYGRFKDRASLLGAVELQLWTELTVFVSDAVVTNDPHATLIARARASRRFALSNPNSYPLLFGIHSAPLSEALCVRATFVAHFTSPLAALVGEDHAFAAARVLIPFLHGFISMELADEFRLADGVDTAFERGVHVVLQGLMSSIWVDVEG